MIAVYYRVTTDNPDGNIALTVSNPRLNIIAEVTLDPNKDYNEGNNEYDVKIVREYMGEVTGITDITNSKQTLDRAIMRAINLEYANRPVAINCDNAWIIPRIFNNQIVKEKTFPIYVIIDGDDISMQTYDYFWDPDNKFQRINGNHQWILYWCNTGGRSGMADISEVSVNAATYPILTYLWKKEDSKSFLNFIENECRVQSLPEFNKKHAYIVDRVKIHEGNKVDGPFEYAIQDVRSALKRKDPAVWHEEYEDVGFDHPRPDYQDKKWKL